MPSSTMLFPSFRGPISTFRSEQVHSEPSRQSEILNLASFNAQVVSRFRCLSETSDDELLSLSWMLMLLDAFDGCLEDFREILCGNTRVLSRPPADKLAAEYFDRSIKAMDIFNAARDGVETIRLWQRHLEIVACAFDTKQKTISEGQFRRARKAVMDLALVMAHEKDSAGSIFLNPDRSFGQKARGHRRRHRSGSSGGHSRSLSWSVSESWSASKQLHSIASNLLPPRANEITTTDGFALLVFSMSSILMFVLWVIVAAIPCQDGGSLVHITVPRQLPWSWPLFSLHSRIVKESKRRGGRNSCGLLKEIHEMERYGHQMMDLVDAAQWEEARDELRANAQELLSICSFFNGGLDALERRLRETFRKVVSCRNEGLGLLGKATEP